MEIIPTVTAQDWLADPDAAAAATDSFVNDAVDLLSSAGFWGSVAAAVVVALKFIPQLAPQYAGIAKIIGGFLAPKAHQEKVAQIEQYAQHYVTTVKVIQDVSNQLPDSNGVQNVKSMLKQIGDSDFHNAVKTITADVHPDRPNITVKNQPSSASQIMPSV